MSLAARLDRPGPKRLLSIDGGGIRGVLAAEVLVAIEDLVRRRRPDVTCLGDWFDFVGGTSTGSILAAGIALGLPARELRAIYLERGARIFRSAPLWRRWSTRYDSAPLRRELGVIFGERRLGDADLRSLLLIVTKNVTRGDTWFFSNNPRGRNFAIDRERRIVDLILASSAAPTYFAPVTLPTSRGEEEFVDGGVSSFNNPSLQLFLEATRPRYGIGWASGERNLLLVSVGTGYLRPKLPAGRAARTGPLGWARHAIDTLMDDANLQQNQLLRTIARTRGRPWLDDPHSDVLPDEMLGATPLHLLTYHRYTTSLTPARLGALGIRTDVAPERIAVLDAHRQAGILAEIGRAVAKEQLGDDDFDGFWD